MKGKKSPMLQEEIKHKIYTIRGLQVMLDRDLAQLYGVETKRLNEQVKRNGKRFPEEFMFRLTKNELDDWMSQIAISNKEKMGIREIAICLYGTRRVYVIKCFK